MDQATRRARARLKAQRTPRGELSNFDARGKGRKLKPAETFSTRQCDYIIGGKKTLIFRRRKDGSRYAIPLIKGGTRCVHNELANGRCLEHLGIEQ